MLDRLPPELQIEVLRHTTFADRNALSAVSREMLDVTRCGHLRDVLIADAIRKIRGECTTIIARLGEMKPGKIQQNFDDLLNLYIRFMCKGIVNHRRDVFEHYKGCIATLIKDHYVIPELEYFGVEWLLSTLGSEVETRQGPPQLFQF